MPAVLTDTMIQLVERQRLGYVATVRPDGTPSVSPKGTLSAIDDHRLAFADLRSPGTVANLRQNPAVEVNVVDPFVRKGYRFTGTAAVLEAGPEFERLVAWFGDRGLHDGPRRTRTVVVVTVEAVRPLVSPGYDRETDEAAVHARWARYYLGDGADPGVAPKEPPPGRVTLVAAMTVRPEAAEAFRTYERRAAAMMARYGGAIERVIAIPADEPGGPFREVHVVTFPDADAWAAYRADPELADAAEHRASVVLHTEVLVGVDGPDYVSEPTSHASR